MEMDEKELKEVRVIRWWKWTFTVLAKFGSIEGVKFDHYVIDWDFD